MKERRKQLTMEEKLREFHFYLGYAAVVLYLSMLVSLVVARLNADQLLENTELAHGFSLTGAFYSTLTYFIVHARQIYDNDALICPSVAIASLTASILILDVPWSYEMWDEVLWIILSFSVNLGFHVLYLVYVYSRLLLLETPESTDPLKEPFIV